MSSSIAAKIPRSQSLPMDGNGRKFSTTTLSPGLLVGQKISRDKLNMLC